MLRGSNRRNTRSSAGGLVPPKLRSRAGGFTLIELLIVMVIIVLLAGVVLAVYGNSVTRAKEAALTEDLFQMRKAIDEYYADKGKYPSDLDALVSEKYLRKIAADPFTGSADTWQTIQSDLDPGNPSAAPGISDVKSGSDQNGLDGRPYAEWE
jgi:general secretion pathway protein G